MGAKHIEHVAVAAHGHDHVAFLDGIIPVAIFQLGECFLRGGTIVTQKTHFQGFGGKRFAGRICIPPGLSGYGGLRRLILVQRHG